MSDPLFGSNDPETLRRQLAAAPSRSLGEAAPQPTTRVSQ